MFIDGDDGDGVSDRIGCVNIRNIRITSLHRKDVFGVYRSFSIFFKIQDHYPPLNEESIKN